MSPWPWLNSAYLDGETVPVPPPTSNTSPPAFHSIHRRRRFNPITVSSMPMSESYLAAPRPKMANLRHEGTNGSRQERRSWL